MIGGRNAVFSDTFLTIAFVGVQLITALAIGLWLYFSMRDASRDLARARIEAVFASVADQTASYLEPVEENAVAIASRVRSGETDFDIDPETGAAGDLEALFLEQLLGNRQFAGIFVGLPNGDFHFTTRDVTGGLSAFRTKTILKSEGMTGSRSLWRSIEGAVVRMEVDPEDPYDPRSRGWYEQADQSDKPAWTEPYVFFTAQRPGTTIATAVRGEDGQLIAVVGIDVELATLTRFAKSAAAALDGSVFIMTGNGEMIAHSTAATVQTAANGGLSFLTVDDLDTAAGDLLANSGSGSLIAASAQSPAFGRVVDSGESYLIGLRQLNAEAWPWIVGVEAREASFVGALTQATWIGVILVLVLGLIGIVVGIRIARSIGGPLAALRSNAQSIVDGEESRLEPVKSRFIEIQETSVALWKIMSRLKGRGDDARKSSSAES